MSENKIYRVEEDSMIINWRKLNESKILTDTELNIMYQVIDKIIDKQDNILYRYK